MSYFVVIGTDAVITASGALYISVPAFFPTEVFIYSHPAGYSLAIPERPKSIILTTPS